VKKATEPLHIQYSYDDQSVVVVNSTYENSESLIARSDVYDFSLKNRYHFKSKAFSMDADSSKIIFSIPTLSRLSKTYFVKLRLSRPNGEVVSENFYWLSTQKEIFDWKQTDFTGTKMTQEADLTALSTLPPTQVAYTSEISPRDHLATVRIENTGKSLAFMTHLKLVNSQTGEEVLPSFWSDNYVSLLPNEKRELTVKFDGNEDAHLEVKVDGWNITTHRHE
jgi:exo-1,4-beta-D-glucosaminidase